MQVHALREEVARGLVVGLVGDGERGAGRARDGLVTLDQLAAMIGSVNIPRGFELALTPERALDPAGEAEQVTDALGQLAGIGATVANVRLISQSVEHYLDQLAALKELL